MIIIKSFLVGIGFTLGARFDVTNMTCSRAWWRPAAEPRPNMEPQRGCWRYWCSIWGQTNCNFDGSGRGRCQTGDCGDLLRCQAYGTPPNTLAEFSLNQSMNLDFFDISLVDGSNVLMEFSPTLSRCCGIRCTADINRQCLNELRAPGGCNNPCTVFKMDQYCCNSGPTNYSRFFKNKCPDAYSYPKDDATSTFTCPGGTTNYRVVFCP